MTNENQTIAKIKQQFLDFTGKECFYLPIDEIQNNSNARLATNPFCSSITSNDVGQYLCKKKRSSILNKVITQKQTHYSVCHAGMIEIAVPVIANGNLEGIMMCYALTRKSSENIVSHKEHYHIKFDIDPDEILNSISLVETVSESQLEALVGLLESIVKMQFASDEQETKMANSDVKELPAANISNNREDEKDLGSKDFFSLYPYMRAQMMYPIEEMEYQIDSSEGFSAMVGVQEKIINAIYYDIRSGNLLNAKERFKSLFQFKNSNEEIEIIRWNVLNIASQIYRCFMMHKSYFDVMQKLFSEIFTRTFDAKTTVKIRDAMTDLYEGLVDIYGIDKRDINAIIKRLKEYMEANYMKQISIKDMAEKYNISVSYASHEFKKQIGVSAKTYLNEIRMDKAQQLLRETDLSIYDIACNVGYTDVRSFYKMFSKHFSVSCAQMRKAYKREKTDKKEMI